jgi:hypothetical protein
MTDRLRLSLALGWPLVAAALLLSAGCKNIFVPKHRVLVDSIAAPGLEFKASGTSYRLVAKKSTVANVQAQVAVIKACVDAALVGKGMFEAPASVPPDLFIEVGFGVVATPRVDAASRETYLQLSARANASRGVERGTGPELWDVRVAVTGVAGRMETAMPLLAAVASDYLGTDTKLETKIEIPQNAAAIGSVRENAIKSLEGRSATPTPAAAGAAVTPVKTN